MKNKPRTLNQKIIALNSKFQKKIRFKNFNDDFDEKCNVLIQQIQKPNLFISISLFLLSLITWLGLLISIPLTIWYYHCLREHNDIIFNKLYTYIYENPKYNYYLNKMAILQKEIRSFANKIFIYFILLYILFQISIFIVATIVGLHFLFVI